MNAKKENKELHALISLLDEPDVMILDKIREKIFSYGMKAVPVLEHAWESIPEPLVQQRIESIIHKVQFDHVFTEFGLWADAGCLDLMKGFILVSRHQYPDLGEEKILQQFGQIHQDVWLEINDELTALEKVKVINHILYDVHKFSANKKHPNSSKNSYIHTVFETRKGNPLSLGIIYLTLAQSQGLPVYGINLPHHFVLAYANETIENDKRVVDEWDILFYINPYNRGAVFTRREIELFIKQLNLKPEKSFFYPCTNSTIIRRLIDQLKEIYENLGEPEKARELDNLSLLLD